MYSEKRSSPRYPSDNEAMVILELGPETGAAVERIFTCRTADVSLRGVRLKLDCALPVNASLRVRVKLGRTAHMFDHTGRVAWCRQEMEGSTAAVLHNAGIEFTTTPGPLLDEWRTELFALLE